MPTPAFTACLKMRLPWWDMQRRLALAVENHQSLAASFRDRADFWNSILEIPAPRILVLQDMDRPPGRGAFVGDMHAAILKALGCVGYLTNGAVRELPAVRTMGIQAVRRKCCRIACLCAHL